jgi:hypothetical protein
MPRRPCAATRGGFKPGLKALATGSWQRRRVLAISRGRGTCRRVAAGRLYVAEVECRDAIRLGHPVPL